MRQHHNVLYILTENASLHQHDASVEIRRTDQPMSRVPRHHLHAIVCFGYVYVSPYLMRVCAEEGISVCFLTESGRFLARVCGAQQGNVLLRRAQWERAQGERSTGIARNMISAKIANCRMMLRRALRDAPEGMDTARLTQASSAISDALEQSRRAETQATLLGIEGGAALVWFQSFPWLLRGDPCFAWQGRSRRPPMDPVNAALSYLYGVLRMDCLSALESAGLDPQIGVFHSERPGRPALALDLMEEFRPVLADRVLFALVNRRQLNESHFIKKESGAYEISEDGKKIILTQYQYRKREEILHPFLQEQTTWGLLPHLQARLLARHMRGDLDAYPAFIAA